MAKFDIIKDYDWTSIPRGSGLRSSAPRVWVKSFKLNSNQVQQSIGSFINIAKGASSGDGDSFYEKMYGEAATPEDDFNFPYFEDDVRSFGNNFGDTFQSGLGGEGGVGSNLNEDLKKITGAVGTMIGVVGSEAASGAIEDAKNFNFSGAIDKLKAGASAGGQPGVYVETPMFYQFEKSDSSLEVRFVLSNTINSDSLSKNEKLIKKLTEINRPLRKNSIAVDPPRIYQVKVPGLRFIRWAYCESFSVRLLGTRRLVGGKVTPEGYEISMSFKSLTLEHAGFMNKI